MSQFLPCKERKTKALTSGSLWGFKDVIHVKRSEKRLAHKCCRSICYSCFANTALYRNTVQLWTPDYLCRFNLVSSLVPIPGLPQFWDSSTHSVSTSEICSLTQSLTLWLCFIFKSWEKKALMGLACLHHWISWVNAVAYRVALRAGPLLVQSAPSCRRADGWWTGNRLGLPPSSTQRGCWATSTGHRRSSVPIAATSAPKKPTRLVLVPQGLQNCQREPTDNAVWKLASESFFQTLSEWTESEDFPYLLFLT